MNIATAYVNGSKKGEEDKSPSGYVIIIYVHVHVLFSTFLVLYAVCNTILMYFMLSLLSIYFRWDWGVIRDLLRWILWAFWHAYALYLCWYWLLCSWIHYFCVRIHGYLAVNKKICVWVCCSVWTFLPSKGETHAYKTYIVILCNGIWFCYSFGRCCGMCLMYHYQTNISKQQLLLTKQFTPASACVNT